MTTRQSRSVGQGARKLLNELQAIVDQETQSAYCYGERLVMLEVFHDFVHHRLLEHTDRYVGLNGSNLHGIPWRLRGFRARHQLLPPDNDSRSTLCFSIGSIKWWRGDVCARDNDRLILTCLRVCGRVFVS